MSVIRVNYLAGFHYGEPAVLVTLDTAGVQQLTTALRNAVDHHESTLQHDGVTHQFVVEPGGADIDLVPTLVVWRLDRAKAREILGYLDTLGAPGPGHQYVDMRSPTGTLVLSCGEYVDTAFPWEPPRDQLQ